MRQARSGDSGIFQHAGVTLFGVIFALIFYVTTRWPRA